ncbi:histone transcription regulator 1 [Pisolithus orientalis]|uniref:histone transcription regulator 1 n=1 Tax=Pisolithus orientalis TaxID=936130 RepID=UPI0022250A2A|nr:histone transcription regulator 1 [Pisolithus orientalis]KAI5996486.1 histone transcription regulator 1 [Pisolithus orientalis]
MRFIKPAWVTHKDNSKSDQDTKRQSVFSIHVHPDGSRIATGGLDAKVRIWRRPPKSLCTLSMHTGPVLTVRWAHSGRWLASGSDDEIIMIWDLDPCVTVSKRIRKLDQHNGFVKGVCFDPVGEFMATQSDDKSVKIWRTTDWELEAEIRKPFEDSPGSTFFRRLSWSPDGAHITASNATNNKGFVFIAAVITRGLWTSEISLVGHENTVEVAAYNPHIFLRNPSGPLVTSNICSVVALGADDRSISIWQTKSARPLIVAREVFERQIMDLSWSRDGLTLYAASSDGTIAVFDFDPEELDGIAPFTAQRQYLQKFGFVPPPVPEGFSHGTFYGDNNVPSSRITPPPSPQSRTTERLQSQTEFGPDTANGGTEQINRLVAKKSNKKRVKPLLMSDIPSASTSDNIVNGVTTQVPTSVVNQPSRATNGAGPSFAPPESRYSVPRSRHPSHSTSPAPSMLGFDADIEMGGPMDMDVPIDAIGTSSSPGTTRGKRKASALEGDDRPARPRTLGGDRPREVVAVREIISGRHEKRHDLLPVPPVLTFLSAKVDGGEDVLEGKNSEDDGPSEVTFVSGKQTQWLDYVQSPIIALTASPAFCAVATQDGSVNVYSHTGRRIMPIITLDAPCSMIHSCKTSLLLLTVTGQLSSINVKSHSAYFPSAFIGCLLHAPDSKVVAATVRHNGAPVLQLSSGVAYTYDSQLLQWAKLSDRWWSEGSDVWQGRQRNTKDVIASIESAITANTDDKAIDKKRPEWWNAALTLGHLESKLHATKALDCPSEYKQALLQYAKKLADEGFRAKAEELIKDMFGPVYWNPTRKEESWSPTVVGLTKRDLLREVLSVFARSKTLTKLALDWQDTLRKASNEELS